MNQPILAPNVIIPPCDLSYPKIASYKLDGNRCIIKNGEMLTRNMKPQGNYKLNEHFEEIIQISKSEGLIFDGEIYSSKLSFTELQTYIRSYDKEIPKDLEIKYYIFDILPYEEWDGEKVTTYQNRLKLSSLRINTETVEFLPQFWCNNENQVKDLFETALKLGYEGLMLRNPKGLYKNGRCTVKQDNIFKLKEFETVDAKIVSFNPRTVMRDGVLRERSETGELKRVNKKDDREISEDLGSITVETKDGIQVGIGLGKGTTQEIRKALWDNKDAYVGKWLEFKYMPHGTKDLPRIGTFVRFRPDLDS